MTGRRDLSSYGQRVTRTKTENPTKNAGSGARGRDTNGVVDGRTAGVAVHRLIAELATSGALALSPVELRRQVATHPSVTSTALPYRQAAKQRLLTAAAIYLRLFPLGAGWRCLGTELPVEDRPLTSSGRATKASSSRRSSQVRSPQGMTTTSCGSRSTRFSRQAFASTGGAFSASVR